MNQIKELTDEIRDLKCTMAEIRHSNLSQVSIDLSIQKLTWCVLLNEELLNQFEIHSANKKAMEKGECYED